MTACVILLLHSSKMTGVILHPKLPSTTDPFLCLQGGRSGEVWLYISLKIVSTSSYYLNVFHPSKKKNSCLSQAPIPRMYISKIAPSLMRDHLSRKAAWACRIFNGIWRNYVDMVKPGAGQKTPENFVSGSSTKIWRHIRFKLRRTARFTKRKNGVSLGEDFPLFSNHPVRVLSFWG